MKQNIFIFLALTMPFMSCSAGSFPPEEDNQLPGGQPAKQLLELARPIPSCSLLTHSADGHVNFSVEWDGAMHHARWVAFSWDAETALDNVKRSDAWAPDPQLSLQAQPDNNWHTSDGFDKGHICASEDRTYSQLANEQTFYYTNISPQFSQFNGGFWESLEQRIRYWGRGCTRGIYSHVWVCKGATLDRLLRNYDGEKEGIKGNDGKYPKTDGKGYTPKGLPVPSAYYMAVLAEKNGKYQAIAFLVPHSPALPLNPTRVQLQATAMSIDELEKYTGEDFFYNLPDDIENTVESHFDLNSWGW